jgi:hypothetical protein
MPRDALCVQQGRHTLTENPEQDAGEQSGGPRNGPHGKLHGELAEDEGRLRQLVAGYNVDPETINDGILDTIKTVTQRIYLVLVKDEKASESVLADMPGVWDDLDNGYHQISYAAISLRRMLKRLKDLEGQPNSPTAELDEAARRVADRIANWLTKVTEFQQNFSEFHKGLGDAAQKSAHPETS